MKIGKLKKKKKKNNISILHKISALVDSQEHWKSNEMTIDNSVYNYEVLFYNHCQIALRKSRSGLIPCFGS